ncbi:MAG: phage tail tip fiber protein [Pseudomonadota bacterium]
MNNRRKALPPIDPKTDPKLRPLLEALKEISETGDGVRGDPMDRKLTIRDLVDAGLARLKPGSMTEFGPPDSPIDNEPPGSTLIPPRPADFEAIGSFGYVVLTWGIPGDLYLNHAFTNVYRGEDDNFANAEMIGRDAGMMYTDHVREVEEEGVGFYYWITFTSTDDVEGPPNSTSGTYAEVIPDIGFLMDRLSSDIDDSKLAKSFLERLPGYQETVSDSGDIYTLTLNQNGYISGLGAYNDGTTSDFTIIADRFWVAPPGSQARRKPFIIQDGKVYIDTAVIREASIQEGQLGPISFGKITDGNGTPVTTVAGKLKGELIEAENLRVAQAAIFYGNVFSNNYQAGVSGWAIYQSGDFEINQGRIRESVQVGNSTMGDIVSNLNNWRRPNSTLIDGNKIFTGDAYVDTLQIKGNAVTIPISAYIGGHKATDLYWDTIVSLTLPSSNAGQLIVTAGFNWKHEFRYSSVGPGFTESKVRVLLGGAEIISPVIFDGEYTQGTVQGGSQRSAGGSFSFSRTLGSSHYGKTIEIQVAKQESTYGGHSTYSRYINVIGAKR